jgi:hypothetical protein
VTLRPLTLVLAAAGCPGASTLIRLLKANGKREISIHGVDVRADAVGRFLCDDFTTIPPGADDDYVPALAAVIARERPDLVRTAGEICRAAGLDWFVNIQFKGDKLLEVNPRVSTFVYQEDFNLTYLGIKYAFGELDRRAVALAQSAVRPSRRTVRYYDQLFWDA